MDASSRHELFAQFSPEFGYSSNYAEFWQLPLDVKRAIYDGMKEIPFSPSDVCWCQPFDGPMHPQCPMHGIIEGTPLSETEQERSNSARAYLAAKAVSA